MVIAGFMQANERTKAKTRLSFQHNAQALSAENTGARGVSEGGHLTDIVQKFTCGGTQHEYVQYPSNVYQNRAAAYGALRSTQSLSTYRVVVE